LLALKWLAVVLVAVAVAAYPQKKKRSFHF